MSRFTRFVRHKFSADRHLKLFCTPAAPSLIFRIFDRMSVSEKTASYFWTWHLFIGFVCGIETYVSCRHWNCCRTCHILDKSSQWIVCGRIQHVPTALLWFVWSSHMSSTPTHHPHPASSEPSLLGPTRSTLVCDYLSCAFWKPPLWDMCESKPDIENQWSWRR